MNAALTLILSASFAAAAANIDEDERGSFNASRSDRRKGKVLSLFQIISFPVSKI